MKIIFLDFDNVLITPPDLNDNDDLEFNPFYVRNLGLIIQETGAKIVVTSSRRKHGLGYLKQMWAAHNYPGEIIDCTPSLYIKRGGGIVFYNNKIKHIPTPKIRGYSIPRGCEIQYWMKLEGIKLGITNYVILDDNYDMLLHQYKHFVMCSNNDHKDAYCGLGLTNICAKRAISILNN